MKKGFTLVELLMVMVIVGALVAVALPKYQRALERSRALEGLTNARAAANYVASYYLTHSSTYPNPLPTDDLVKSRFFGDPVLDTTTETITVTRTTGQGWEYQIKATLPGGEITALECVNTNTETDDCEELDLVGNLL